MAIVMRVVAFANGEPCPIAGQYLKSFDFNAEHGRGYGEFTRSKKRAMKFPGFVEAFTYWKTVSDEYPTRKDGQPNRPLTATTVSFEKA